jgi:uncharacterized membrane protein
MNDLEKTLGRLLRIGVTLSTLALGAGLAASFLGADAAVTATLLRTGIIVLIGTPVARVAVSSMAYARNRDWIFVVLTLAVLGELVASILAAVRRG